jgi:osmotically-inducible protein OsmY
MKTNEELREDVMEEIKWDPSLKSVASEIGVTAKDGVVTLSGLVDTYSKKLAAEKAAQRVSGVKVVAVDIEVKAFKLAKTDTEIAEAIRNALRWNSKVNEDKVEVKVDDGWVYLSGKVDWDYQKRAAQTNVEDLVGVKGITNSITVESKAINPIELKNKISSAYHRIATVDSSSIQVDVSGTTVTLRGTVRSWAEKKEAEDVAWSSPGVMTVNNKIEINTAVYA